MPKNRAVRKTGASSSLRSSTKAELTRRIESLEQSMAKLLQVIEARAPALIQSNEKLAESNDRLAEAMEQMRPKSAQEREEDEWSARERAVAETAAGHPATNLSADDLEAQRRRSAEADRLGGV